MFEDVHLFYRPATVVLSFVLIAPKQFNRPVCFNSSKIFRKSLRANRTLIEERVLKRRFIPRSRRSHICSQAVMCAAVPTNFHRIWLLKETTLNVNSLPLRQQTWLSTGSVQLPSETESCQLPAYGLTTGFPFPEGADTFVFATASRPAVGTILLDRSSCSSKGVTLFVLLQKRKMCATFNPFSIFVRGVGLLHIGNLPCLCSL